MSAVERTARPVLAVAVTTLAVLVLLLLVAPQVLSGYHLAVLTRIVIFALFGMAFNLVFGAAGLPAFGHAAFFGAGGYVVGLSFLHWDFGFWAVFGLIILVSAVLGFLFGVITIRVEELYLFLLTLALAQAIWGLAFQQVAFTRGDNGIAGISRAIIPLFPSDSDGFYYFCLLIAFIGTAVLWRFSRSPVGRAIVGTRESATRMTAMGYNVILYRNVAFVVSAVFSGIAGGLYVLSNRFVGPDILDWPITATVWIVVIIGGARVFLGPWVGAAVLLVLETWISSFTARWPSVLGLLFMATIIFLPDGVLGRLSQLARRFTDRREPMSATPPALTGAKETPTGAKETPTGAPATPTGEEP